MESVSEVVRRRADDLVEVLAGLVAIPSVNPGYDPTYGGEKAAQEYLADTLAGWGIAPTLWEPQEEDLARFPDEVAAQKSFSGRPNLMAELGQGTGGRTLILNSHIDVVGIPPDQQWDGDPFRPVIRDGWLQARGAMDAKGPLAAMVAAMGVVKDLGVPLRGKVTLQSVVDEEQGGGGTLAFIGRGYTADAAIVGEPSGLAICPATRGSRRFRVHVRGKAAHPARAYTGVNAISKAYRYITALEQLAARLDRERPHPLWADRPVQHVFNLNGITGGHIGSAGVVPEHCVFEMAAGGTAAETLEQLQADVERTVAQVTAADDWLQANPPTLEWMPQRLHPSVTDPAHPLVQGLGAALTFVTGGDPVVRAMEGVTDMRHLVRYAGIPTVNFGPGSMEGGHGPNERISLEQYITAVVVLARFIMDWCR